MSTAVRSRAKINLGLSLGPPRPDGFHSLITIYQTLEMHDVVTVTARPASATVLRLTSNHSGVPTDSRNTAWKMTLLALKEFGLTAEVEIHIDKRLPVQGGLGAGSGNAVAALVGLEKELGIASQRVGESASQQVSRSPSIGGQGLGNAGPSTSAAEAAFAQGDSLRCDDSSRRGDSLRWAERRLELAAQVGSDVPLFLVGGTVLGLDRGQQVSPLPDLEPTWCVVAVPETGVSTQRPFAIGTRSAPPKV